MENLVKKTVTTPAVTPQGGILPRINTRGIQSYPIHRARKEYQKDM